MIFRIKYRWQLALVVSLIGTTCCWYWGGWTGLTDGPYAIQWQVFIGMAGGLAALLINGVVHVVFIHVAGDHYRTRFQQYSLEILDGMRWPEYLAGGLMAAVFEEPLFRGLVLRWFVDPTVGIAVAALLFAACHWLRWQYFGFWIWALWEGVLFGLLLLLSGSLLVPIIAHGLHDVAAYITLRSLIEKKP